MEALPFASCYVPDILVIHYFPVTGSNIDVAATGDWGESLAATREKTRRLPQEVMAARVEGSRCRGYRDSNALPCCN